MSNAPQRWPGDKAEDCLDCGDMPRDRPHVRAGYGANENPEARIVNETNRTYAPRNTPPFTGAVLKLHEGHRFEICRHVDANVLRCTYLTCGFPLFVYWKL